MTEEQRQIPVEVRERMKALNVLINQTLNPDIETGIPHVYAMVILTPDEANKGVEYTLVSNVNRNNAVVVELFEAGLRIARNKLAREGVDSSTPTT